MCFHVAQPIFVTLSITLSLVAPTEEDELGASEPASTNENFAFQSIELSSTYSLWSSLYNSLIWFLSIALGVAYLALPHAFASPDGNLH
jgi:hypothetical protein